MKPDYDDIQNEASVSSWNYLSSVSVLVWGEDLRSKVTFGRSEYGNPVSYAKLDYQPEILYENWLLFFDYLSIPFTWINYNLNFGIIAETECGSWLHNVSERDDQYLYESMPAVTPFGFTVGSSNPSREKRHIKG